MAIGSRVSIIGLYNYDPDIFEDLVLPDQIDKDQFIDYLLMRLAEMPMLYGSATYLKAMIGVWSNNRLHTWERMAKVLYEDYDPFINIKRDEERTVTQERDLANSYKTRMNAWDDASVDGVQTGQGDGTDTGTVTTHEIYHLEGDSAITDAQDVARKEMDMRQKYNLINIIVNEFKAEFCLSIY